MKKVLITGIAGLLGSHFSRYLLYVWLLLVSIYFGIFATAKNG